MVPVTIPLDIQRSILDQIPNSSETLLHERYFSPFYSSLCLVSKAWHEWVKLVLYKAVYLTSPRKAVLFFAAARETESDEERSQLWNGIKSIQLEGCSTLSRLAQENIVSELLGTIGKRCGGLQELDLTTDCRMRSTDIPRS